jgi:GT2 family glycosyltransferase
MSTPRISVILPCYNHARYIKDRVKSIEAQTIDIGEIIFLDDSSTDNSLALGKELLARLKMKTRIISNSKNSSSPFAQWNLGVSLAVNDLIWIAETDDSCDPALLETLYTRLIADDAVMSFSHSQLIDQSGQCFGTTLDYTNLIWPDAFEHDFTMDGRVFNQRFMSRLNAVPNASGVLFRREAYIKAGMANPSMRLCGDWDAWMRVAEQGNISFVTTELNHFRCHATTTRSEGHSPRLAAERLACRLRACLQPTSNGQRNTNISSETHLGVFNLMRLVVCSSRSALFYAIFDIKIKDWYSACKTYQCLEGVIKLSSFSWLVLSIMRLSLQGISMLKTVRNRYSAASSIDNSLQTAQDKQSGQCPDC